MSSGGSPPLPEHPAGERNKQPIADDINHQIRLATELAHDLGRLAQYRTILRPRLESSPIMNVISPASTQATSSLSK